MLLSKSFLCCRSVFYIYRAGERTKDLFLFFHSFFCSLPLSYRDSLSYLNFDIIKLTQYQTEAAAVTLECTVFNCAENYFYISETMHARVKKFIYSWLAYFVK
jgi:hypothetical protein